MCRSGNPLLLLADIDGTLLSSSLSVGPDVVALSDYAHASGGALVPVSARPVDDIARLFAAVESVRLGSGSGGGVTGEMRNGVMTTLLHEETLDLGVHRSLVAALERAARRWRGAVFCFGPAATAFRVLADVGSSGLDAAQVDSIVGARPLESVDRIFQTRHLGVVLGVSVLARTDSRLMTGDLARHALSPECRITGYPEVRLPGWSWLEVFPAATNKADASRRIVQSTGDASLCLGVRPQVVAVGDSIDDIGMFAVADVSYCPASSSELVRLAASVTLPAIGGPPFARALLVALKQRADRRR